MLEQKLEEATRKSRNQLMITVLAVLILLLGAAVIYLVTQLDHQSAVQTADPVMEVPSELQPERQPYTVEKTDPQLEPSTPPIPSTPQISQDRSRQEIIDVLNRYEMTYEETVKSEGFGGWDSQIQKDLLSLKDQIIQQLANGQLEPAFEEANKLISAASTATAQYEATFEEALINARLAFQADDHAEALFQINRALELKPVDEQALNLLSRIEKLPMLLGLIDQARVAATENNLEKELALSKQVVELDPDRITYEQRIKDIESLLTEQAYDRHVAAGLAASREENLQKLQSAYSKARQIFPNREETENLLRLVNQLKEELSFRQFVAGGEAAIQADDWDEALRQYQNANALRPNNGEIVETINLSEKILQATAQIQKFLGAPQRLSAETVRKQADRTLEAAALYSALSPGLAKLENKLETEIERRNIEVEVWVISDQLTNVSVRGIGKVGVVERYKIKLKPGEYMFEGRREGFRTKSVSVTIKPEDRQIEVTVISNERI